MEIIAAVIEAQEVVNVIVVSSLDFMPNLVEIPEGISAGIGYKYIDGQFIAPT